MKVKELRQKLADAPDDAEVVVPAPDHEFDKVTRVHSTTAFWSRSGGMLYEDHGDEHKLAPADERTSVVIIGD